jgi:ATP-independent RNA helicase DbpA
MASFADLGLAPAQLEVLQQLEYFEMTPIQAASLPVALAGRDLIARAKTGSGKTAAFALPLLARLNPKHFGVQALVLCPTRELAEQVAQEIRRLARAQENIKVLTLCGGSPARTQVESLAHGAHVIVGTPGRIMDHLQRETLKLESLATLVLDEADRMLDMGFHEDITWVVGHCPVNRQTLLFSATYPEGIASLAARFMREPQEVMLAETHEPEKIRQRFYEVEHEARLKAVGTLLRHYHPESTLAFCNTRQQCKALFEQLRSEGIHVLTLHGELDQHDRDQVLIRFANRSVSVLVATDVAARGLDIAQLECVINVDVTPDPEVHTHRVGRTGRADQHGWALSLASSIDRRRVDDIARANAFIPEWHTLESLEAIDDAPLLPAMSTIQILAGKRDKIRPGDIMGALAATAGLTRDDTGKINIGDQQSYVAVPRANARDIVRKLGAGKLKGRAIKARLL